MAKFKLSRREGSFGAFKNRVPEHGANGKTEIDLPVSLKGTKRDMDALLLTVSGAKASEILYTDGIFEMPYISPLTLGRTIEGLLVQIWDEATRKAPLRFSGVTAKDIVMDFSAKHIIEVKMKLVLSPDPDKELPRLARLQTLDTTRDIEIEGQQGDIFGVEEEEEEGEQTDMVGEGNGEESGEDPEDDDEEEE
jgi:hypothetical protein